MKRVLILVLLLVSFSTSSFSQGDFETVQKAIAKMGPSWNLDAAFDIESYETARPHLSFAPGFVSDLETYEWCPVVKPALINMFADAGFTGIRLDVCWGYTMDPDSFEIRRDLLDRVQQVVDMILESGMYCIVNSMDNGFAESEFRFGNVDYDNYETSSQALKAIWRQVADRFKDYGEKLLFEMINEPVNTKNQWGDDVSDRDLEALNMMYQDFVNIVRSSGGSNATRNLVVTIYTGQGQNERFYQAFRMPRDVSPHHIMASIHAYSDFSWDSCPYDSYGPGDVEAISTCLSLANKYFVEKGIPCIVGEMGSAERYIWNGSEMQLIDNEKQRADYIKFVTEEAAQYGMPCFIWPGVIHKGEDRGIPRFTFPLVKDTLVKYSPKVGRTYWNTKG